MGCEVQHVRSTAFLIFPKGKGTRLGKVFGRICFTDQVAVRVRRGVWERLPCSAVGSLVVCATPHPRLKLGDPPRAARKVRLYV